MLHDISSGFPSLLETCGKSRPAVDKIAFDLVST